MCDSLYHLYWWEIEPYLEIAQENEDFDEPRSQFGLKGMMFDTVNELFLVLQICSLGSTLFDYLYTHTSMYCISALTNDDY